MRDAASTTPSEGKNHRYPLTFTCSEVPCPNHVVEVPCRSEGNASNGLLQDIDVQSISRTPAISAKDQCWDVRHFFSPLFVQDGKSHRNCNLCLWGSHKYFLNVLTLDIEKGLLTVWHHWWLMLLHVGDIWNCSIGYVRFSFVYLCLPNTYRYLFRGHI